MCVREYVGMWFQPRPDFILQLWRKLGISPRLQDKIWEWPGNEARDVGCRGWVWICECMCMVGGGR